ncbi:MarR family winged helix-turn-helix transcriptional regulator [Lactococcus termiticola]|uniref:ArsR family transcriptional regulator n=1 Tax=Lactococcus termiticola TaxID=2169526 RepID=A0A2R5HHC6_9LACT|nr:MarR family transcriptional regulator [Lactococcus termiticola]GBG97463.1 ArsR family transcriptional regulator [Lactococcus termiticola]
MSEQTNNLLHLFSKVLRNPRFMLALRMDSLSQKLRLQGARNGAQGLLVKLWEKDGLTNAEIAEMLDIRPSSVTAQVKQLEEQGLVERQADENDGRVSRVFLTEKGWQLKDKRIERHDNLSEELFRALTDEEQQELTDLLEKFIKSDEENEFDWTNFDWHTMTKKDWRALRPEERQAFKRQLKKNIRMSVNDTRDFGHGFGPGRPNGDFWDWVTGPDSEDDIPDWNRRHGRTRKLWNFGENGRGGFDGHGRDDGHGRTDKKKNDDWTDF